MRVFSSSLAAIFMLLALGAPVLAEKTLPNTIGYAWWSTATPDQKALVVQGEIDALPIGFTEPMIAIAIVSALTGNSVAKGLQGDLDKVTPIFSKTPAQYVPLVDAAYAKPEAQKLSLGLVVACLADTPYGSPGDSTDKCLTSFEH
jgi:hypothetical protein